MSKSREIVMPDELHSWLERNEVRFYLSRSTRKAVRDEFQASCGVEVPASVLRDAIHESCRFYGVARRRRLSVAESLPDRRWDLLRRVAESLRADLKGRKPLEALDLFRACVCTNMSQLNGLPKRCRVWKARK